VARAIDVNAFDTLFRGKISLHFSSYMKKETCELTEMQGPTGDQQFQRGPYIQPISEIHVYVPRGPNIYNQLGERDQAGPNFL